MAEKSYNAKRLTPFTMSWSGLITTILIIVLGIADLCFVLFAGTGSSVSSFLVNAGFRSPVFCIALGFVNGHLTGQMYEDTPEARLAHDAQKKRDLRTALCVAIAYEGLRTLVVYLWGLI
jgi:hypothetical protein